MKTHWYAKGRYQQAESNLKQLLKALSTGDETAFTEIVENEALSLHALLMSSAPGTILMHPNTIEIIRIVQEYRASTKLNCAFTLDAGPNIHLLYSAKHRQQMLGFILSELVPFCKNGVWIDDKIGIGPSNT